MSSNPSESEMIIKKTASRTLKEIIEAANQGVEAPSEKERRVFLCILSIG